MASPNRLKKNFENPRNGSPLRRLTARHLFLIALLSIVTAYGAGYYNLLMFWKGIPAYTWVGRGADANWTNTRNWSTQIVPGVADTAIFDNNCVANCSPTINTSISIGGVLIKSNYGANTITQGAGNTVTIGSAGWIQSSGTFTGSGSNITINGAVDISAGTLATTTSTFNANSTFALSGTGIFSATSGTKTFTGVSTISGGTFTGGSSNSNFSAAYNQSLGAVTLGTGTNTFTGAATASGGFLTSTTGTHNFSSSLTANGASLNFGSSTVNVTGTLTMSAGGFVFTSTSGNLNLTGGLNVSGAPTFDANGGALFLVGSTQALTPGTITYNNVNVTVKFENGSSVNTPGTKTVTGTWNIGGKLTLAAYAGCGASCAINTGTLSVSGNVEPINDGAQGTANISMVGGSAATLNAGTIPSGTFTVNKTAATVTLSGTPMTFGGNAVFTNGTFNGNTNTINYNGTMTVNGATYNTGGGTTTITGALDVSSGTLATTTSTFNANSTFALSGTGIFSATSGTKTFTGVSTISGGTFTGGSSSSNFSAAYNQSLGAVTLGTGTNTFTGAATASGGTLTSTTGTHNFSSSLTANGASLNFGSSTVNVTGTLTMSAGGFVFTSTSGSLNLTGGLNVSGAPTFDANGGTLFLVGSTQALTPGTITYNNVNVTVKFENGSGVNTPGTKTVTGTWNIGGKLTLAAYAGCGASCAINTGTLSVSGNVEPINDGAQGTANISMVGGSAATLNAGTIPSGTFTVNKTAATVTLSGTPMTFGGNAVFTNGTFNGNTNTINYNGTMTVNGATYNTGGGANTFTGAVTATSGNLTALTGTLNFSSSLTANGATVNFGSSTVNVTGTLGISAGAFTSTSGNLNLTGDLTVSGAPTFNANSGTLVLVGSTQALTQGNFTYNNVTVKFENGSGVNTAGTKTVAGTWTIGGNLNLAAFAGCGAGCMTNGGTLSVSGNVTTTDDGSRGNTAITLTGATNTTVSAVSAGTLPSGLFTVNKSATANTVTLLGSVNVGTAGQNMTITRGTVAIGANILNVSATLTVALNGVLTCTVGGNFTHTTLVHIGTISCNNYPFNWVGTSGDGLWSTGANWLGGSPPGLGNIAYFETAFCTPNCNVNIDVNVTSGIRSAPGFTGTITQGASTTINTGTDDFQWASGTFLGSSASITVAGGNDFILSGGTFTSTSGNFNLTGGLIVSGSPTFIANAGTLVLTGSNQTLNPGTLTYNNVTFRFKNISGVDTAGTKTVTGTWTIGGNLNLEAFAGCGASCLINGGTLNVSRDVTPSFDGARGSTNISMVGNIGATLYAGTIPTGTFNVNKTGATVTLSGTPMTFGGNAVFTNGTFDGNANTINYSGTMTVNGATYNTGGGTNTFTGAVTATSGNLTATTGTLNFSSTLTANGATVDLGSSTVNVTGTLGISAGTFTSTSDNLNLTGGLTVSGSPTFNANSGTVRFTATQTITPLSVQFNNVTFAGNAATFTTSGTMIVNGTLLLGDSNVASGTMTGGTISARGDVNVDNNGYRGTTEIQIAGSSGTQTITNTTSTFFPALRINTSGSSVVMSGTFQFQNGLTYSAGTLTTAASSFIFNATQTITLASAVNFQNVQFAGTNQTYTLAGAASFSTLGTLTLGDVGTTGAINGNSINARGNLTFTDNGFLGTSSIIVNGSTNQTVTGIPAARIPVFQINSSGGTVTLSGTLRFNGNFTYTAGTISASGSTLNFVNTSIITTTAIPTWGSVTFNGAGATFTLTGTMVVGETLTIADTGSGFINTGTLEAKGNIVANNNGYGGTAAINVSGNTNQTISGISSAFIPALQIISTGGTVTYSGTLRPFANYTVTSGTVDASTATMRFERTSTITPNTVAYNIVTFASTSATFTLSGTLTVNGLLTAGDTAAGAINGGIIDTKANITLANNGYTGTTQLRVSGSSNQTITGIATASIPATEVVSTGGTVTYAGTLLFSRDYLYTSGAVTTTGSTLVLNGSTQALTPGTPTYNDVTFKFENGAGVNTAGTKTVTGTWDIGGTLRLEAFAGCGASCMINSGTLNVSGNVTPTLGGARGSANITMVGGTAATLTSGTIPTGTFTVNKTAGATTVTLSGTPMTFGGPAVFTNGTFDGNANTINYSGTMTVNGATYNTGGGTNTFTGAVTASSGALSSTTGTLNFSNNLTASGATVNFGSSTVNVTGTLDITAGTFTSTSGNLNLAGGLTVSGAPTFNANSGTLVLVGSTQALTPSTATFNNVTFRFENGSGVNTAGTKTVTGTWDIGGTLSLAAYAGCGASCIINGGTLNVSGNLTPTNDGARGTANITMVGGGARTLTAGTIPSGTFTVNKTAATVTLSGTPMTFGGPAVFTTGTFNGSGSTINYSGTMTVNGGNYNTAGGTTTVTGALTVSSGTLSSSTATFNANSTFALSGTGTFSATTGTNTFAGAVTASGGNLTTTAGTQNFTNTLTASGATVNFGSSTVNVTGNLDITAGTFTSTSGNLNLAGGLSVSGAPTFDANSGTVRFTATQSITPSTISFNNVVFNGNASTFTNTGTLTVNGTLTLGDSNAGSGSINGGDIAVSGNVTYNNFGYIGTATMTFAGSAATTLAASSANLLRGNVTVNKTGIGTLTLSNNINFNGAGQTLSVTAGTILMSGRNLTIASSLALTAGTTVNRGGGVLTANGSTVSAGVCCGGGTVL